MEETQTQEPAAEEIEPTVTSPEQEAKEQKAEEVSAKLAAMLEQTSDEAEVEKPEPVEPEAAEKEKPEPKAKDKPLARGEYEIELPRYPQKVYAKNEQPEMGMYRFFKPKKWTLAASDRNARWWHVVDEERVEETGQTLCRTPISGWMGVKYADRNKQPITCPWCLVRMLHSKAITQERVDQVKQRLEDANAKEAQAKADAKAKAKEAKAAEAKAEKAEADAKAEAVEPAPEPDVKPDPKPTPRKRRRGRRNRSKTAA